MAHELVEKIRANNARGESTRAIIPCGPGCWYDPFVRLVNAEHVDLHRLVVFHMDECLDWQGRELPTAIPTVSEVSWSVIFIIRSTQS